MVASGELGNYPRSSIIFVFRVTTSGCKDSVRVIKNSLYLVYLSGFNSEMNAILE